MTLKSIFRVGVVQNFEFIEAPLLDSDFVLRYGNPCIVKAYSIVNTRNYDLSMEAKQFEPLQWPPFYNSFILFSLMEHEPSPSRVENRQNLLHANARQASASSSMTFPPARFHSGNGAVG